jgi:multidrug resistance efflux pump
VLAVSGRVGIHERALCNHSFPVASRVARGVQALLCWANVNPSFSWGRLAQRIPVRIALDPIPAGISLGSGRTAALAIDAGKQRRVVVGQAPR